MPDATAAAAVAATEGEVPRVDTEAVQDNGSLKISEQDDRLYRHITLPNKMQVDIFLYWRCYPMIQHLLCPMSALNIARASAVRAVDGQSSTHTIPLG